MVSKKKMGNQNYEKTVHSQTFLDKVVESDEVKSHRSKKAI